MVGKYQGTLSRALVEPKTLGLSYSSQKYFLELDSENIYDGC